MDYGKVSLLIDRLRPTLLASSFFYYPGQGEPQFQKGIIRSNCLDCLDRTNLVQSFIAFEVLPQQLKSLGVDPSGSLPPLFIEKIRSIWANSGDSISLQYAGAGALKVEYTRTGNRSILGGLNDGMKSLTRYYVNNFLHGEKWGITSPKILSTNIPFPPQSLWQTNPSFFLFVGCQAKCYRCFFRKKKNIRVLQTAEEEECITINLGGMGSLYHLLPPQDPWPQGDTGTPWLYQRSPLLTFRLCFHSPP